MDEGMLEGLLGQQMAVVRQGHNWLFRFGENNTLMVGGFWRICADHVLLTSEDDEQQFGLPASIDAERNANSLLANSSIRTCDADPLTGDLQIVLDNGLRFEVISTSSGYETWTLKLAQNLIVGRGDGLILFEGDA